jgi:hypothetical protein
VSSIVIECWIATLSRSKIGLCAPFECNVALHVDTTTSANGIYKISQKSAEDISEDQENVTKGLSEAPNQDRKMIILTSLTSVLLVKASPGHIPLPYLHCNLCLSILCLALSLEVEVQP